MKAPVPLVCPKCGACITLKTDVLTERQAKVLKFVATYIHDAGFSPILAEIAAGTKLSKGIIIREIDALVRLNLLRRPFRGQRSLALPKPEKRHERAA